MTNTNTASLNVVDLKLGAHLLAGQHVDIHGDLIYIHKNDKLVSTISKSLLGKQLSPVMAVAMSKNKEIFSLISDACEKPLNPQQKAQISEYYAGGNFCEIFQMTYNLAKEENKTYCEQTASVLGFDALKNAIPTQNSSKETPVSYK